MQWGQFRCESVSWSSLSWVIDSCVSAGGGSVDVRGVSGCAPICLGRGDQLAPAVGGAGDQPTASSWS
jgi:hypothetical protein